MKEIQSILIGAVLLLVLFQAESHGALVISEFTTSASSDWVEVQLRGEEAMDISPLLVTMYYGSNESLADEPVTLRGSDLPDTPWNDRYAVIHFTDVGEDETDSAGDINGNGIRDIYCQNYSGTLWNTDGIVAIDSDDDPENGGILDMVAYSHHDGGYHSTILGYIEAGIDQGQWMPDREGGPGCFDIGENGLKSHMSVSRKEGEDSNSADDFQVTPYQTPGRPNIFPSKKNRFPLIQLSGTGKKILLGGSSKNDRANIRLLVHENCRVSFQVFSVSGLSVSSRQVLEECYPGIHEISWKPPARLVTGLYLGLIEATSRGSGRYSRMVIYLIISRGR